MVVPNDRTDDGTTAERVRSLARRVAAGQYRIDAEALAIALLRRAQVHRAVCRKLIAEPAVIVD